MAIAAIIPLNVFVETVHGERDVLKWFDLFVDIMEFPLILKRRTSTQFKQRHDTNRNCFLWFPLRRQSGDVGRALQTIPLKTNLQ